MSKPYQVIEVSLDNELTKDVIQKVGTLNVGDNQVLGKLAPQIIEDLIPGFKAVEGGTNDQRGVTLGNDTYGTSANKNVKAGFVKSADAGGSRGKNGKEVKKGDAFIHIKHVPERNSWVFSFYTKEVVQSWIK